MANTVGSTSLEPITHSLSWMCCFLSTGWCRGWPCCICSTWPFTLTKRTRKHEISTKDVASTSMFEFDEECVLEIKSTINSIHMNRWSWKYISKMVGARRCKLYNVHAWCRECFQFSHPVLAANRSFHVMYPWLKLFKCLRMASSSLSYCKTIINTNNTNDTNNTNTRMNTCLCNPFACRYR